MLPHQPTQPMALVLAELAKYLLLPSLPWGPIKHFSYVPFIGKIAATVEATLIALLRKGDASEDNIKRAIYETSNFDTSTISTS